MYHIDQNDNVHFVTEVESHREAHEIVIVLQALGDQGLLPQTFYVYAPRGSASDVAWMLRSLHPTKRDAAVDYTGIYQASIEERQLMLKEKRGNE